MSTTLDPADWQIFRQQAHAMLNDILSHMETLRAEPVWQMLPAAVRQSFKRPIPKNPTDLTDVHNQFLRDILPFSSGNSHPGFLGWVQGAGTAVGMVAEMLAAGMNSNLGGRDHAPLEVERQVVEWMRELFGFPRGATGLFVTGTSQANLTAIVVARDAALSAGAISSNLTAYASTAVHTCVQKALHVCGFDPDSLRLIRTDQAHQIDVEQLAQTVEADRRQGFSPFLIVGTAGSVDIGAIDNLTALADFAVQQSLWFHVDGAYAAMALLAKDLAPKLIGIERADSIAFDFHKWAQVPYPAGFLMVRDGTLHRESFASSAAYLRREQRGLAAGVDWPCDLGIDLSRGFEALKTWFTFNVYGANALGDVISETCVLARYLETRINESLELELMAPVQLNIVCFRFRAHHADRVNAKIVIDLQEAGHVAPSTTTLAGHLAIRAAIVNHRTTRRDLDLLITETLSLGRAIVTRTEECRPPSRSPANEWEPYRARIADLALFEKQIAAQPQELHLHMSRANILSELGRINEARAEYLAVLTRDPAHRDSLNNLGTLLYGTGYRTAARTAFAEAVAQHPQDVASLVNLANVLLDDGNPVRARQHYSAALRLQSNQPDAHQGLARALLELGDNQAADLHFREGFATNSVTTLPYRGNKPPLNLLLLVSALGGNPPVRHFLDDRIFQTSVLTAEYHNEHDPLPLHHLVFNAIGDADLSATALQAAETILTTTAAPIINSPRAVAATGRVNNARRLRGLPGVITPITKNLPRELLDTGNGPLTLARHGLQFPVLVRTPGFHTGRHFIRIDNPSLLLEKLAELPGRDLTIMQYLDARGLDGKTRKYRVMMINGKLYPLHLAVSSHWKIHYFTAEMADNPRHRAEDAAFLENMAEVLGDKAMTALRNIQSALQLDYAGIDFGLNHAGDLLLFEANATMVVPRPAHGEQWAYRLPAVERIHTAVRAMLLDRANSRD